MGIDSTLAYCLATSSRRFRFGGILCTLGVQDIRSTPEHLEAVLAAARVDARLSEPDELYRALGFVAVESVDVSDFEGCTHVMDLNTPGVPPRLRGRYQVVYNGGTLEHVFDIRTALRNVFELLDVGGIAIHAAPTSGWVDHGFYQFSPTLLTDYYSANGFEVLEALLLEPIADSPETYIAHTYVPGAPVWAGAAEFSGRWLSYVSVRKRAESTWDAIPRQSYYAALHFGAESPDVKIVYRPPFRIEQGIPAHGNSPRRPLPAPRRGEGFEWIAHLPELRALADSVHKTGSPLVLFEDDEPIGPAHVLHDDIRTRGRGRYSHWDDTVRFAPSRNDDADEHVYSYALQDLTAPMKEPLARTRVDLNRLVRWSL
jgi:hypothetical protein